MTPLIDYEEERALKRVRSTYENAKIDIKPLGTKASTATKFGKPIIIQTTEPKSRNTQFSRESIQAVIAAAAEAAAAEEEAAAAAVISAAAALAEVKSNGGASGSRKKHKPLKKIQTVEEKEANKEKRLLKLVGAVVVKCMSKYSKSMDHDMFKKHAKEVSIFSSNFSKLISRLY